MPRLEKNDNNAGLAQCLLQGIPSSISWADTSRRSDELEVVVATRCRSHKHFWQFTPEDCKSDNYEKL